MSIFWKDFWEKQKYQFYTLFSLTIFFVFYKIFLCILSYLFILSIFWIDFRVGIIIVGVSNIKKHLENEKNRSIRSFEYAFICMFKEWR